MRAALGLAFLSFLGSSALAGAVPFDPGPLPDPDEALEPTRASVEVLLAAAEALGADTGPAMEFATARVEAGREVGEALLAVVQDNYAACPAGAAWQPARMPDDPLAPEAPEAAAYAGVLLLRLQADPPAVASAEAVCRYGQAKPFIAPWDAFLP